MTALADRTASQLFAEFATGMTLSDVPPDVQAANMFHLLDTLGCGIAAVGTQSIGPALTYAAATSSGGASGIGVADAMRSSDAALVNGIACHALDFDNTHAGAMAHVSAVVVPAAVAVAEERGCSGEELLTALIAGSETTCRLGNVGRDAFHLKGFHPTSICGIFGATVAVARLCGLSVPQTVHAMGLAGSMAAGLMAYLSDGSSTKQLHPGWAAHSAVIAVQLAQAGATGPAAVLEGRNGLYSAFLGKSGLSVEEVAPDLGQTWETRGLSIKPYPACHFVHAPLDALKLVMTDRQATADDIRRITVFTPQAGANLVAEPLERKIRPATPYEGKFSVPYVLAAWLKTGNVNVTTFNTRLLNDPAILDIAARVDYCVRDYDSFPGSLPGGVRVELANGEVIEKHVPHHLGSSAWPVETEQIAAKYRENARTALSDEQAVGLQDFLLDLSNQPRLDMLRVLAECSPR